MKSASAPFLALSEASMNPDLVSRELGKLPQFASQCATNLHHNANTLFFLKGWFNGVDVFQFGVRRSTFRHINSDHQPHSTLCHQLARPKNSMPTEKMVLSTAFLVPHAVVSNWGTHTRANAYGTPSNIIVQEVFTNNPDASYKYTICHLIQECSDAGFHTCTLDDEHRAAVKYAVDKSCMQRWISGLHSSSQRRCFLESWYIQKRACINWETRSLEPIHILVCWYLCIHQWLPWSSSRWCVHRSLSQGSGRLVKTVEQLWTSSSRSKVNSSIIIIRAAFTTYIGLRWMIHLVRHNSGGGIARMVPLALLHQARA